MITLKDLTPDERNANKGTPRGQKMIVASIAEDGFGRSILLDKNGRIIAGNKSAEASAEVLGVDAEVVVVETDGNKVIAVKRTDLDLDDLSARRLAYRDNLAGAFSFELDPDVVMADIESGFDFEAIDISLPDLGELMGDKDFGRNGHVIEDEAPVDRAAELQAKWGTELGQLWQLGAHRLVCGDCTDKAVVERVMDGERAALFNTDPPYGVAYGEKGTQNWKGEQDRLKIASDTFKNEKLQGFLEKTFKLWSDIALKSNAAWYLWHAHLTQGFFAAAAAAANVILHRQIIWVKPSLILGMGQYHWRHEPCFFGWIEGNQPPDYGDRTDTTVWEINRQSDTVHPTEKPVELFARPILKHTEVNDICAEPFCGSGSQIIACEQLNRRCRGIEIDPGYVAVTLERWHTLTGEMPVLLDTSDS